MPQGRFLIYVAQYSWEGLDTIPEQLNRCRRKAQDSDLAEYDPEMVFEDRKVGKVSLGRRQAGLAILNRVEPHDVILMQHYNRGFLSLKEAAACGHRLAARGVVMMDVRGLVAWGSLVGLMDGPWGTRTAEADRPCPIGWRLSKDSIGGVKYVPCERERKFGDWFQELSTARSMSHVQIAKLLNQCASEATDETIRDFIHPRTGGHWTPTTVGSFISCRRAGFPLGGKSLVQVAARAAALQRAGSATANETE